jgi:hypothetical protein
MLFWKKKQNKKFEICEINFKISPAETIVSFWLRDPTVLEENCKDICEYYSKLPEEVKGEYCYKVWKVHKPFSGETEYQIKLITYYYKGGEWVAEWMTMYIDPNSRRIRFEDEKNKFSAERTVENVMNLMELKHVISLLTKEPQTIWIRREPKKEEDHEYRMDQKTMG